MNILRVSTLLVATLAFAAGCAASSAPTEDSTGGSSAMEKEKTAKNDPKLSPPAARLDDAVPPPSSDPSVAIPNGKYLQSETDEGSVDGAWSAELTFSSSTADGADIHFVITDGHSDKVGTIDGHVLPVHDAMTKESGAPGFAIKTASGCELEILYMPAHSESPFVGVALFADDKCDSEMAGHLIGDMPFWLDGKHR